MIHDLETEFYALWDHAIWLNEVLQEEIWLFCTNGSPRIFGLLSSDQNLNDDHCEQCRNEFLLFKLELAKDINYLAAVCDNKKLKRIQNGEIEQFNKHCVLIDDIINQPDICFQKMKEIKW